MKLLRRIVLLVALTAVAVPAATIAALWLDASAAISRAKQMGVLPRQMPTSALSRAETVIALGVFEGTWQTRRVPCRPIASLGDVLSGRRLSGHTVSGALAMRIVALEPMTEPDHSLWSHSRAVLVACQLEQNYTDEQLLKPWLSRAYFGRETFGIGEAARSIFNKNVDQLNQDEAARLAALLRAPHLRDHPDRWAERAKLIAERAAARDAGVRP